MKKFLLLMVFAVLLLSGALLSASGDVQVEEEYDEDTYGPKDPVIWDMPVRGVVFNHKTHTMDGGMDCDACHDDLFEMEAGVAQENDDFNMATMYEGGYCGACHDGSTAFAANTRCTTCHIGVRGVARLLGEDTSTEKAH
ncbi:MAG: cytochrome c3 family protein [Desulforhopalus sp.]